MQNLATDDKFEKDENKEAIRRSEHEYQSFYTEINGSSQ